MATVQEMKRVIQINRDFGNAKQAYLEAKAVLVSSDDITDDEATSQIDRVIETRNALITAAINMAKVSPIASPFVGQLEMLEKKARTSPSIREQLINAIIELEID